MRASTVESKTKMHATGLLSNKIRNQVYLRCTVHGYFIQDEQIGFEHFLLSES